MLIPAVKGLNITMDAWLTKHWLLLCTGALWLLYPALGPYIMAWLVLRLLFALGVALFGWATAKGTTATSLDADYGLPPPPWRWRLRWHWYYGLVLFYGGLALFGAMLPH